MTLKNIVTCGSYLTCDFHAAIQSYSCIISPMINRRRKRRADSEAEKKEESKDEKLISEEVAEQGGVNIYFKYICT